MRLFISLCAFFATYAAAGHAQTSAPPSVRLIAVERNVKLQVVDWGGSGRPVVLLAGLGVTARDFDGFAHARRSVKSASCHSHDGWYRAFGIKPGDRLYLDSSERARIW